MDQHGWKQREGSTTTLTIAGDVLISGTQWGGLYGTTSALANNSGSSPTTDSATEVPLRSTRRKIMDHLLQKLFPDRTSNR